MSGPWTITTAQTEVTLDPGGNAQVGFTVTNSGDRPDRSVVDVEPGDGAAREWFTVTEPQRSVPAGASVPYFLTITVPAGTAPARSWVSARVWSADGAPDETSVLSNRVAFTVAATPAPPRRRPLWIIPVAVLVIVVLGVVGFLVLRPRDVPATVAVPTTVAVPPTVARMPDLVGLGVDEATAKLTANGLTVGGVAHRYQPASAGRVLEQSVATGVTLAPGDSVNLVVAIDLTAPTLLTPPNQTGTPPGASTVVVAWTPVEGARSYHVNAVATIRGCRFALCSPRSAQLTDQTVATTSVAVNYQTNGLEYGVIEWQVAALDDFDNPGPTSRAQVPIGLGQ